MILQRPSNETVPTTNPNNFAQITVTKSTDVEYEPTKIFVDDDGICIPTEAYVPKGSTCVCHYIPKEVIIEAYEKFIKGKEK